MTDNNNSDLENKDVDLTAPLDEPIEEKVAEAPQEQEVVEQQIVKNEQEMEQTEEIKPEATEQIEQLPTENIHLSQEQQEELILDKQDEQQSAQIEEEDGQPPAPLDDSAIDAMLDKVASEQEHQEQAEKTELQQAQVENKTEPQQEQSKQEIPTQAATEIQNIQQIKAVENIDAQTVQVNPSGVDIIDSLEVIDEDFLAEFKAIKEREAEEDRKRKGITEKPKEEEEEINLAPLEEGDDEILDKIKKLNPENIDEFIKEIKGDKLEEVDLGGGGNMVVDLTAIGITGLDEFEISGEWGQFGFDADTREKIKQVVKNEIRDFILKNLTYYIKNGMIV